MSCPLLFHSGPAFELDACPKQKTACFGTLQDNNPRAGQELLYLRGGTALIWFTQYLRGRHVESGRGM